MLNTILTGLFKVVFALLKFISNVVLLPITLIVDLIMPDFSSYTAQANYFIDNYLLKAIACGREIFLNLTGFPQELLTISVNVALALLGYIGTIRVVAFVKNLWRTFKGGD